MRAGGPGCHAGAGCHGRCGAGGGEGVRRPRLGAGLRLRLRRTGERDRVRPRCRSPRRDGLRDRRGSPRAAPSSLDPDRDSERRPPWPRLRLRVSSLGRELRSADVAAERTPPSAAAC